MASESGASRRKRSYREALGEGLILGLVGLAVGSVAGWTAVGTNATIDGLANTVVWFYRALAVVLPLGLVLIARSNLRRGARAVYGSGGMPWFVLALAGGGGAVVATALFLVPSTNLPAIIDGFGEVAVRDAIVEAMGLGSFLGVVAAGLLGGLGVAVWVVRRA